ncbi:TPA: hypothetical protein U1Z64_000677 [Streptococcus suis]|nr:hypothetical protein [Streptococcus suis]HEM4584286.1 hypothetical protein [Streptococcus suis]
MGIDTSFFALIVAGGAENFISGICFMLVAIASKSISRRSTARRQTANIIGNWH